MVVYMLTDLYGRQNYMVPSVRSARGKGSKQAFFQPMFALEIEGAESPKMQLHRIKDVHNGIVLRSLPFDVRKSTIALFMAETLYRLVRESEQDELLFDYVWNAVATLDVLSNGVSNYHLWFLSNLTRFLGFAPGNSYCIDGWFDIREGLFVPDCPSHEFALSCEHAKILDAMLGHQACDIAQIRLNRHQRVSYLNALLSYFGYHLDAVWKIQSVRILQEVF